MPTTIKRFRVGKKGYVHPFEGTLKPGEFGGFTSFENGKVIQYRIECSPDDASTKIFKIKSEGGLVMIQSSNRRIVIPSQQDIQGRELVKQLEKGQSCTIHTITDKGLSAGFTITHT